MAAMVTVCHIVAVHEPSERVLATLTPVGWLLPTLVASDLAASGSLLTRAIAALPLPARPRCQANLQIDRASGSANVMLIVDVASSHANDRRLVPIATLRETTPVVGYQKGALELLSPPAGSDRSDFLTPGWIRGVADWVGSAAGAAPNELLEHATVHRAEVDRAVVTFEAGGRLLHFKGERQRPFVEALATRFISAHAGSAVASTLAFEETRGWWLMGHVDGVPLDGRCWPAHLNAAETWASLQRKVRPVHDTLCALGVTQLHAEDLALAATDALHTAAEDQRSAGQRDSGSSGSGAGEREAPTAAMLTERVSLLLEARIARDGPTGVLHFDAAPRNVLWNGDAAVFLDLESLCVGPAVIAGELMARRMRAELSSEQRLALTLASATHALRLAGDSALEAELWRLPALTDLCLLAVRRRWLFGTRGVTTTSRVPEAAASEEPAADATGPSALSARYAWRHLALDFAARASRWPSSPNESGSAP